MLSLNDFSLLTSKIYASALNAALWQDVVDFIHEKKDGMKIHLFGYDLEARINLGQIGAGYSEEFQQSYGKHYFKKNVLLNRYFEAPIGLPVSTRWMLPTDQLCKTEFYSDWLRPQENIIGGGSLLLFKDDSRMITFGSNIRAKAVDQFERTWLNELKLLSPHLQQAFEISRALAVNAIEKSASTISPVRDDTAMLVVGLDRHILHCNANAEELLGGSAILTSQFGRKLRFANPDADEQFSTELAYFRALPMALPRTSRIPAYGTDAGWILRMARIEPGLLDYSPAGLLLGAGEPAVLVTLIRETPVNAKGRLKERYGLTDQESGIALQLAEGLSISEIADVRDRSVHTVRNQIKAVMAKLGVKRQAAVVKALSELAGELKSNRAD